MTTAAKTVSASPTVPSSASTPRYTSNPNVKWAWSHHNVDQLSEKLSQEPVTLKTESLKIPGEKLVLTLDPVPDATARLLVTIGCSKRKVTLNRSASFPISGAN